jgi:RNA polymerase sigma factor (sigma-70 family)
MDSEQAVPELNADIIISAITGDDVEHSNVNRSHYEPSDDFDIEKIGIDERDDIVDENDAIIAALAPQKTTIHEDATTAYMSTALKLKILSRKEELPIAMRAKAGDVKAKELMMLHNLRLVVKIAKKFQHNNMELMDLVSEGNIGLMTAIERFEPERGFKFSTYATWWIRQSVSRALSNQSRAVRWPVHVVQKEYEYRKVVAALKSEGESTTPEVIAERMGMTVDQIKGIEDLRRFEVSSSSPMHDDGGDTLEDTIVDSGWSLDERVVSEESSSHLLKVYMTRLLTQREYDVIAMRFGMGVGSMTLEEVGHHYKLTRERIRQIESKSLRKLRHHFVMNGLQVADLFDGSERLNDLKET